MKLFVCHRTLRHSYHVSDIRGYLFLSNLYKISLNIYLSIHCQSSSLFSAFNLTLFSFSLYSDFKNTFPFLLLPFNVFSLPSEHGPISLTRIRKIFSALDSQFIHKDLRKHKAGEVLPHQPDLVNTLI